MPDQAMFNPIPDLRPRTHPGLPHIHPYNQQCDHIYSVSVPNIMLVREINETSWHGFDTRLAAGTRILIRNSHASGYNMCYQLVATDNAFRRLIYIYAMDEMGPDHDITSEEYFQNHYQNAMNAPNAPTAAAALPNNILDQSWANAVAM
jgi:hypothetical protein